MIKRLKEDFLMFRKHSEKAAEDYTNLISVLNKELGIPLEQKPYHAALDEYLKYNTLTLRFSDCSNLERIELTKQVVNASDFYVYYDSVIFEFSLTNNIFNVDIPDSSEMIVIEECKVTNLIEKIVLLFKEEGSPTFASINLEKFDPLEVQVFERNISKIAACFKQKNWILSHIKHDYDYLSDYKTSQFIQITFERHDYLSRGY